jgi:hypothetical protein
MKKFGTKVLDKNEGTKFLDKNETCFMTSILLPQVFMLFDIIKQYTANVPECYILMNYGTTA